MHSIFLNSAQRRIATKGPHGWRNGNFRASVGTVGGMVHADNLTLGLRDPANFDFRPAPGSPLRGAGVRFPPYVTAAQPDVGAYQASDRSPWRAGCTFHSGCDAR